MREEVGLARQVHANCIRLWIEFTAWFRDPDRITAHFMDAVAAISENGMKVMPCLFNRWHNARFDYGGTYNENLQSGDMNPKLEYVRALVEPLATSPDILIWDLCNEPKAGNLQSELNRREYAWLKAVADVIRESGASQPITIGTVGWDRVTTYAPLCDVLCFHVYSHTPAQLARGIKEGIAFRERLNKPMLVNEAIPGTLDDQVRGRAVKFFAEQLSAAGLGWMGWALKSGKAVASRRDRIDGNGISGEGYHPFFTSEGKLRGGLEFLTEQPKILAPWESE